MRNGNRIGRSGRAAAMAKCTGAVFACTAPSVAATARFRPRRGRASPPRLRAVGRERGSSAPAYAARARSIVIARKVLLQRRRVERIHLHGILAEYLALQRRRELGIAVLLAQLRGDLERAKRVDLVLRRAVPDAVGAPEHVVLADGLDELAQRVRRARRIAHQEAPGRAELGVDVRARLHVVLRERVHERVHALVAVRRVARAFRLPRHEARVVDEELHVRDSAAATTPTSSHSECS